MDALAVYRDDSVPGIADDGRLASVHGPELHQGALRERDGFEVDLAGRPYAEVVEQEFRLAEAAHPSPSPS